MSVSATEAVVDVRDPNSSGSGGACGKVLGLIHRPWQLGVGRVWVHDNESMGDENTIFRCFGTGDPLSETYHDHEWGVPIHDEGELFERLVLEGFQCGLSWSLILRRREGLRGALAGFAPSVLAKWGDEDVERLLSDERVIRNRNKIRAALGNARALLKLHESGGRLGDLIWSSRPEAHQRPRTFAEMPATTRQAEDLARALKKAGFRFVGPTTMYATMQAVGVVNDHLVGCPAGDAIELSGWTGSDGP